MRKLKLLVACGLLSCAWVGCGSATEPEEAVSITTMDDEPVTDDEVVDDSDDTDPDEVDDVDDTDNTNEPVVTTAPVYDGECPTMVDGGNSGFRSAGLGRNFRVALPDDPQGAPVLFAWHWLGGNATTLMNVLQLSSLAKSEGVIIIAPESNGGQFEWRFTEGPENNPDLQLFEDLLACADEQFDVDLDRVYSTGHSAGGLWTSYLSIHASEWLASTAVMSGGANAQTYVTPDRKLPVLVIWGGPTDTYGTLSFAETSTFFADALREDGHFVTTCEHSQGHLPPVGGMAYIWRWLQDHPHSIDEPYVDGLPDVFPEYCDQPDTATE